MKEVVDLVFVAANKRKSSSDYEGRPMLFPDCTVSINHSWENDISEHPIERGSSVVDHAVSKNGVFEVSGIFDKYTLQSYQGNSINSESKIQEAYDYLLALRNSRQPFTLVSKYSAYPNCIVKSLQIPVSPTDGKNSLVFSMSIQQVRLSESESVTLVRAVEVAEPFRDSYTDKESKGRSQLGLAIFEGNPFKPKGTTSTTIKDRVTKIPYTFGGG